MKSKNGPCPFCHQHIIISEGAIRCLNCPGKPYIYFNRTWDVNSGLSSFSIDHPTEDFIAICWIKDTYNSISIYDNLYYKQLYHVIRNNIYPQEMLDLLERIVKMRAFT
jgi:hypothetical protein